LVSLNYDPFFAISCRNQQTPGLNGPSIIESSMINKLDKNIKGPIILGKWRIILVNIGKYRTGHWLPSNSGDDSAKSRNVKFYTLGFNKSEYQISYVVFLERKTIK
jgi:hypothetical protein